MTQVLYPSALADRIMTDLYGKPNPGATMLIYADAGGDTLAPISLSEGGAQVAGSQLVADYQGYIPQFWGPDGGLFIGSQAIQPRAIYPVGVSSADLEVYPPTSGIPESDLAAALAAKIDAATTPQQLSAAVAGFVSAAQAAAAAPVQSVAGRAGAVTIAASDVGGLAAAAATAAPVQTVAGRSGAVVLGQADITGLVTALAAKADLVGGMVPTSQIPPLALTTVVTVANAAARYALTSAQVQPGDVAVQTSTNQTFMLIAADPSQATNWTELTAIGKVQSVNGQQGVIVLGPTDVGALATANNLSDLASASTARTNLSLGTAATQAKSAAGTAGVLDATDPTTTNARTPTAHATTHATGGADPLTPAAIGAYVKPTGGIPTSDLASPTTVDTSTAPLGLGPASAGAGPGAAAVGHVHPFAQYQRFTASGTFTAVEAGVFELELVSGGGSGAGAGAAALTSGVSAQTGGGAGGSGVRTRQLVTLAAGASITLTIAGTAAGGTGGAASAGTTGNAGTTGSQGNSSSASWSGGSLTIPGGAAGEQLRGEQHLVPSVGQPGAAVLPGRWVARLRRERPVRRHPGSDRRGRSRWRPRWDGDGDEGGRWRDRR